MPELKDIFSGFNTDDSLDDTDTFAGQKSDETFFQTSWSNIKAKLKAYFDTIYQASGNYLTSSDLIDEDDMSSDSTTKAPTQQSTKAYINAISSIKSWAASTDYIAGERLSYDTQFFNRDFVVISNHNSSVNPLTDILNGNLRVISEQRRNSGAFTYPDSWNGPEIDIYYGAEGVVSEFETDKQFRDNYIVPTTDAGASGDTTYYVSPNGDDTTGLSPATALNSFSDAVSKADALTIMVESGYSYVFGNTPKKSINIIGYGDPGKKIYFYSYDRSPTISQDSTYPNVYTITETVGKWEKPLSALSKDENGMPIPYIEKTTKQEVSETPLSFYKESNTVIHVHTGDGGTPVLGETIYLSIAGWKNSIFATADTNTNTSIYIENAVFTHALRAFSSTGGNLYMNMCASLGGVTVDAWNIGDLDSVVLRSCLGAYSEQDGFSYEAPTSVIEVNCHAYRNGDTSASNQASTVHSSTNILRVCGLYEGSGQNAILDVGSGQSLNIGCVASGNTSGGSFASAATRKIWFLDCYPSGAGFNYQRDSSGEFIVDGNLNNLNIDGSVELI